MGDKIDKLLRKASGALSNEEVRGLPDNARGRELAAMLAVHNGFYAFESALLVRGAGEQPGNLANWNDQTGWRLTYGSLADGLFFFAEDVFGGQFAIDGESIITFDPETGAREHMAASLEEWAGKLLSDDDYDFYTGYSFAHNWQQANRSLERGERLAPRKPFFIGGDYDIANLFPIDDVEGMCLRGEVASQVKDLPEGTPISITYGD